MSIETLAAESAADPDRTDPDRYQDLATGLGALDDVDVAEPEPDRRPPRVAVKLNTANVPGGVVDLLDHYGAVVVADSLEVTASGRLRFEVTTPALFRPAGARDARRYGEHSIAWTFTPQTLELSGFDEDSRLEARAREGAVLLTEQRDL